MAMNGTDILIMIDGNVVGSQRDVSLDENTDEIDVSSKEQREKRVLAGRYSASISLDALYVPDDAAYLALVAANRNGTAVEVICEEDGVALENADAIVTHVGKKGPDQGEAVISVDLTIDGAWAAGS